MEGELEAKRQGWFRKSVKTLTFVVPCWPKAKLWAIYVHSNLKIGVLIALDAGRRNTGERYCHTCRCGEPQFKKMLAKT